MDQPREIPCEAPSLPQAIAAALRDLETGHAWARSMVGQSGGDVWRVADRDGRTTHFLKHGSSAVADALVDELARLRWLAPHVPVPHVSAFVLEQGSAWLLMSALPGETAWEVLNTHPERADSVVVALAAFVDRFHAIPATTCPFTASAANRLHLARHHIDAGLVDEDDFDDCREGWSAEQVWSALLAQPLPQAAPVVTHGDFSLDNILIENGAVTGCIDVGRAGLADRYQDIAILWNCLGDFGPGLQSRLLAALGEGTGDRVRIDFHLLLDELF